MNGVFKKYNVNTRGNEQKKRRVIDEDSILKLILRYSEAGRLLL